MKSAVKRKLSAPTLEERVIALMSELDQALDQLAEARRPASVPLGSVRMMIDSKALCHCMCRAYLTEIKNK